MELTIVRGKNITIPNLTLSYPGTILLDNTDLKIVFGQKYALIGNNGIGKSSLLKYIYDNKHFFSDISIMNVEQESSSSNKSVFDEVIEANTYRVNLLKQLDLETEIENINCIEQLLNNIDSDSHESIVRRILFGLGFNNTDQTRAVSTFSGGFRMRISLAKALYLKPDVLLLDEPNNHLDLDSIIWLTDYLTKTWKNTLVVISHDKNFINEICTDTIHIESKKLTYYKGNYDKYIQGKKLKELEREKKWKGIQNTVKQMRAKNATKTEINKYLLKNEFYKPQKPYLPNLHFGIPTLINAPIIALNNVSIGYSKSNPIVSNINLEIGLETKYVIVGKNGSGKTTLFKTIMNKISTLDGSIIISDRARIGYYNQHATDILPLNQSPCEYLISIDKTLDIQTIRKYLGIIGLDGKLHTKPISTLSGGQKSRVLFVSVIITKPHLLLLDEPTNHLDMDTIDGLINSINDYQGSIIVSTHNIDLIKRITCHNDTKIMEINNNELIIDINFNSYCEKILFN